MPVSGWFVIEEPADTEDGGASRLTRRFHRTASERLWGKRLDQYLIQSGLGVSRTRAAQLIDNGKVRVNDKSSKPSYRVKPGDEISASFEPEPEITLEPQKMDLNIVYEDDDILVLDKAAGIVVHPARGNRDRTLVNALLYHCKSLPLRQDSLIRPGVVHRLDKHTTGLLMFAKTDEALRGLGYQIEHRLDLGVFLEVRGHVRIVFQCMQVYPGMAKLAAILVAKIRLVHVP